MPVVARGVGALVLRGTRWGMWYVNDTNSGAPWLGPRNTCCGRCGRVSHTPATPGGSRRRRHTHVRGTITRCSQGCIPCNRQHAVRLPRHSTATAAQQHCAHVCSAATAKARAPRHGSGSRHNGGRASPPRTITPPRGCIVARPPHYTGACYHHAVAPQRARAPSAACAGLYTLGVKGPTASTSAPSPLRNAKCRSLTMRHRTVPSAQTALPNDRPTSACQT